MAVRFIMKAPVQSGILPVILLGIIITLPVLLAMVVQFQIGVVSIVLQAILLVIILVVPVQ